MANNSLASHQPSPSASLTGPAIFFCPLRMDGYGGWAFWISDRRESSASTARIFCQTVTPFGGGSMPTTRWWGSDGFLVRTGFRRGTAESLAALRTPRKTKPPDKKTPVNLHALTALMRTMWPAPIGLRETIWMNLWIAGRGLSLPFRRRRTVVNYTTADGFGGPSCKSIVSTPDGVIWFGTGTQRHQPLRTRVFSAFRLWRTVLIAPQQAILGVFVAEGAAWQRRNGTLWFASGGPGESSKGFGAV